MTKKVETDLPNSIKTAENQIKHEEERIKVMQEKNDQLLNNCPENDEDFIEYVIDPKTRYTFQKVETNGSKFELS